MFVLVMLAVMVVFVDHCPGTKSKDKENDDAGSSWIEEEVAGNLPEDFKSQDSIIHLVFWLFLVQYSSNSTKDCNTHYVDDGWNPKRRQDPNPRPVNVTSKLEADKQDSEKIRQR